MPDTYYVDFDGTICCDFMDNVWHKHYESKGLEETIKIYDNEKTHSGECLNTPLLTRLHKIKSEEKVKLILFTNRRRVKKEDTLKALAHWHELFDDMIFCDGKKVEKKIEGYLIDNERKYLNCCEKEHHFIEVETFACKMKK